MTAGFLAETLAAHGWQATAGEPAAEIRDGSADSRLVKPGDVFAGFRGEQQDGNAYLERALEAGATAVVGERAVEGNWPDRAIAVVPDTRAAVATLAGAWRARCNPQVVGITGTVGKTTAKEFCAAVLRQHFRTHKSKENFNSREGLPLTLASLETSHEVSVLEMAMDSRGEIRELCEIARPDVGIVLNVGLTHVSKLGSVEAIQAEKLSLAGWLPESGVAVLNADDPLVAPAIGHVRARVISFGRALDATLRIGEVDDHGLDGCSFALSHGQETATVRSPLPGAHLVPAATVAVASAMALGVPFQAAAASVESAEAAGRMGIRRLENGVTVLDDTYNSSPASLEGALRLLGNAEGRRIAVLGAMAELGDYEAPEHRRLGTIAAGQADLVLAAGAPCRDLVDAAREAGLANARWYETREELGEALARELRAGDVVLLKASRSQAFEALLPAIEGAT
ncbi:MAG: UDP-N-acetylmuramoyl-tripeptide--D-alanyl-D-alanine ligase [Dehalococcoidia bacterium]|nr:UDP-N-acetylmuramoyl-tripeptide--D-alanyl-D-alanine ligase [Dehalococcoidia bacterium]